MKTRGVLGLHVVDIETGLALELLCRGKLRRVHTVPPGGNDVVDQLHQRVQSTVDQLAVPDLDRLGPGDQLGSSVSTSRDVAAAGAPFDDHAGLGWAGSVQVFVCARAPVGDLDGDGAVGITDLLALLSAWDPCPDPPETCPDRKSTRLNSSH